MIVPVPIGHFQIPEFPDRNFRMHEMNNKRFEHFYRLYPKGHMDILPSPIEVYEYCDIDKKHKIVFQIIREGEDASFMNGNYKQHLVFYWSEKTSSPLFFWRREWQVIYEIPIEEMEKNFNIPFRENCRYSDELRKKQYQKWFENEEARSKYMIM